MKPGDLYEQCMPKTEGSVSGWVFPTDADARRRVDDYRLGEDDVEPFKCLELKHKATLMYIGKVDLGTCGDFFTMLKVDHFAKFLYDGQIVYLHPKVISAIWMKAIK